MDQLGRIVFKYRKSILVIWLLLLLTLGAFASKIMTVLEGDGFKMNGEFAAVAESLNEDFNLPSSTLILFFEKEKSVSHKEFTNFIEESLKELEGIQSLTKVDSPLEHKEQFKPNVAYATLSFHLTDEEMHTVLSQIKSKVKDEKGINIGLTGGSIISKDMDTASQNDLKKAELIGLPIALIVLLLAFGGIVTASIPLVSGILSVISSMGIIYFIGQKMELSIFVLNIVPMIGLALGIDFALLFINRFREELKEHSVADSIVTTVKTAGRSIAFSGLCVLLGLLGLLVFEIDLFRVVAISGVVVVLISVLNALTFLPAFLSLLGTNINRLTFFKEREKSKNKWHAFAKFVMKKPLIMAVVGFAILLIGVLPVSNLKLSVPNASSLPKEYESRTAYEKYEKEFVGENYSQAFLIVEPRESLQKEEGLKQVELIIKNLKEEEIVLKIDSIFSFAGNISAEQFYALDQNELTKESIQPVKDSLIRDNKTIVTVSLKADSNSQEAKEFAREWTGAHNGVFIKQGGMPKFNQEVYDEITNHIGYALAFTLTSTFLILLFAFRSVMIPLKAIIMNIISLSSTFGILVWLFQGGHLGIEQSSSIGLMIPVFIFSLVFGLSMDYEVFLISRIHEVYEETKDNDRATLEGLTSTSKIITSAALIMIVVTGAFAFTGVEPIKQLGIGMSLAIAIDATLIRMLLVPALMKMMGHLNWWAPKVIKGNGENRLRFSRS